jgi:hypothetical protein
MTALMRPVLLAKVGSEPRTAPLTDSTEASCRCGQAYHPQRSLKPGHPEPSFQQPQDQAFKIRNMLGTWHTHS